MFILAKKDPLQLLATLKVNALEVGISQRILLKKDLSAVLDNHSLTSGQLYDAAILAADTLETLLQGVALYDEVLFHSSYVDEDETSVVSSGEDAGESILPPLETYREYVIRMRGK